MTLRLQDTLSGETRPLEPLEPGHVRIYSCGPTVYGPTHIGNFRSFLFADLLVRYLRYRGLRVTWVMNITDIDDRIIERANAAGETTAQPTDRWLERFKADFAAVRMTPPVFGFGNSSPCPTTTSCIPTFRPAASPSVTVILSSATFTTEPVQGPSFNSVAIWYTALLMHARTA